MGSEVHVFLIAISLAALIVVGIYIPIWIAQARDLPEDKIASIKILSYVGLILPFLWIIAIILSIVYSPKEKSIYSDYKSLSPNSYNSIKNKFTTASNSHTVNVPLSNDEYVPLPNDEYCENCDVKIGKLETPMIWNNKIVCKNCYKRLAY